MTNNRVFTNSDEINADLYDGELAKAVSEFKKKLKKEWAELDYGDQVEMSLEEQLEIAEWELNCAQTNYFRLYAALQKRNGVEDDQ